MSASRKSVSGSVTPVPTASTPDLRSGSADRRVEPRVPPPSIPVEERREITDAITFPASGRTIDRFVHAVLGRMTFGVSPAAATLAYWTGSPIWRWRQASRPSSRRRHGARPRASPHGPRAPPCSQERRRASSLCHRTGGSRAPSGSSPPFNFFYQWFLLNQQWWWNATTSIRGMPPQKQKAVSFMARQILDVVSPSNFVLTNPEVLKATAMSGGLNFVRGFANFLQDVERDVAGRKPVGTEAFVVGRELWR